MEKRGRTYMYVKKASKRIYVHTVHVYTHVAVNIRDEL